MLRLLASLAIFGLIFGHTFSTDAFAQVPSKGNPGWWQGKETPPFAGGVIRNAYCDVISYMEGNLGGMLMVIAGVLAMATAAFGNFKHGATAIGVGIVCFSMSTIVGLFFGQLCGSAGGGDAKARTNSSETANLKTDFSAFNDALAVASGHETEINEQFELQATDDEDESSSDPLQEGF